MQEAPRLLHEEVQFDCEIRWTNRDIRNYFAMARWNTAQPPCSGSVDVNRILNSPDISGATLKFLIWHELVHLYLQAGHTSRFRELERLWDGYIEADRELDTLNERFGVFHY